MIAFVIASWIYCLGYSACIIRACVTDPILNQESYASFLYAPIILVLGPILERTENIGGAPPRYTLLVWGSLFYLSTFYLVNYYYLALF